jgi:hypothetical protein
MAGTPALWPLGAGQDLVTHSISEERVVVLVRRRAEVGGVGRASERCVEVGQTVRIGEERLGRLRTIVRIGVL